MSHRFRAGLYWLVVGSVMFAMAAHAGIPPVNADGSKIPSLAPMVERVSPAIVNIATRGTVQTRTNPLLQDPFFRHFFDVPEQPTERQVQSLGSGVIVDAEAGYILTNHHVIANADQIRVALNDNREFDAELIGSDPETDVAVIRIKGADLAELPLADSDTVRVGDYVVAIGNPFGLDHTVTTGVVSGLGRRLGEGGGGARLQNFIQTDASINPGNSGGALVDLHGRLVGINTAILSRSGGNIGIGFAIPVNMAMQVMGQIVKHGEVRRGVLGVRIQDLTPEIADAMDLGRREGALVAQVTPNSAADAAGIREGDVIVRVNGKPIGGANDLATAVGLMEIGERLRIVLVRDGETQTVTAEVGDPQDQETSAADLHPKLSGATFSELDERSPLFGRVEGVLVTGVENGSPAAAYLRAGDVITSVNRESVSNMAEFRDRVEGQDQLLLNIRRGESARFVLLR